MPISSLILHTCHFLTESHNNADIVARSTHSSPAHGNHNNADIVTHSMHSSHANPHNADIITLSTQSLGNLRLNYHPRQTVGKVITAKLRKEYEDGKFVRIHVNPERHTLIKGFDVLQLHIIFLHQIQITATAFSSPLKVFLPLKMTTIVESIVVNIQFDTTVYGVHMPKNLSYVLSFAKMEKVQKCLCRQIHRSGRVCHSISQSYFLVSTMNL
jgi:hypothetical protein